MSLSAFENSLSAVLKELAAMPKPTTKSVYYHCLHGFVRGFVFAQAWHMGKTDWWDNQLENSDLTRHASQAAAVYVAEMGVGQEAADHFIEGYTTGYMEAVDYDGPSSDMAGFMTYAKSFSQGYQAYCTRMGQGGAA
ncbi:hypothetical protein ACFO3I_04820 [Rheinheimera marina]|uniref:Uncharacterized protein n=1 Tax=Rheinheimera marina TaxID=1774958 RepID=A0ABV9JIT5_9GAMM